jgi:hypothetical protein
LEEGMKKMYFAVGLPTIDAGSFNMSGGLGRFRRVSIMGGDLWVFDLWTKHWLRLGW